jgi:RNA polymerase sigma-70 factor, ECF subfamily
MEEFVSRAKKGDRDAFLSLVEGRLSVLYKIAFSYFKNKDDASDAVQDSTLIAYKNIKRLKNNSSFNSWITTILVNRCKEILRKSRKLSFQEYSEDTLNQNHQYKDEYLYVDTGIDVLSYLQKLDDKYREVITLKYFGDHSIKEIAEILEIPSGTVKSRINYGLNKLKLFMEVKTDGM